jgi:DNA-directed RNA polymerase sigma subunit (sigma70/sigma32)
VSRSGGHLSEREADIIRLRFGFAGGRPHTLDEINRISTASP